MRRMGGLLAPCQRRPCLRTSLRDFWLGTREARPEAPPRLRSTASTLASWVATRSPSRKSRVAPASRATTPASRRARTGFPARDARGSILADLPGGGRGAERARRDRRTRGSAGRGADQEPRLAGPGARAPRSARANPRCGGTGSTSAALPCAPSAAPRRERSGAALRPPARPPFGPAREGARVSPPGEGSRRDRNELFGRRTPHRRDRVPQRAEHPKNEDAPAEAGAPSTLAGAWTT